MPTVIAAKANDAPSPSAVPERQGEHACGSNYRLSSTPKRSLMLPLALFFGIVKRPMLDTCVTRC